MFIIIITIIIVVFVAVKIYNAQEAKLQTETYRKRSEEQKAKQNLEKWTHRYGKEDALRMLAGEIWVGMSVEQLLAVKGQPNRKTQEHLKTIFEFGGIQRRFVVTVEDLKVAKIA